MLEASIVVPPSPKGRTPEVAPVTPSASEQHVPVAPEIVERTTAAITSTKLQGPNAHGHRGEGRGEPCCCLCHPEHPQLEMTVIGDDVMSALGDPALADAGVGGTVTQ